MEDIYLTTPRFQSTKFIFRKVSKNDLNDLYHLYSDKECFSFFNVDNVENINYYCKSLDDMKTLYNFWKIAYKRKWFTRLSVISKDNKMIIGCIEMFVRHSFDSFDNSIVLRVDLIHECETYDTFNSIIETLIEKVVKYFGHRKIIIKAMPEQLHRIDSLKNNGFVLSRRKMIGDMKKEYNNYYIYNKYNY